MAASLLHDAGMNLDAIADMLGHRLTRMLEQHYRHRVRNTFDGHLKFVGEIFGHGDRTRVCSTSHDGCSTRSRTIAQVRTAPPVATSAPV